MVAESLQCRSSGSSTSGASGSGRPGPRPEAPAASALSFAHRAGIAPKSTSRSLKQAAWLPSQVGACWVRILNQPVLPPLPRRKDRAPGDASPRTVLHTLPADAGGIPTRSRSGQLPPTLSCDPRLSVTNELARSPSALARPTRADAPPPLQPLWSRGRARGRGVARGDRRRPGRRTSEPRKPRRCTRLDVPRRRATQSSGARRRSRMLLARGRVAHDGVRQTVVSSSSW